MNINLLDWTPQNPDMNPMENLWDSFDNRAHERYNEFHDNDTLLKVLDEEEEALKIEKPLVIKLYQSIPRRINTLKTEYVFKFY